MVIGILLGVGAATFQSFAYLFSRMFSEQFKTNPIYLLTLSHIVLAIFALLLFPFFWPDSMPPFGDYALSLFGSTIFYLLGHACLFLALANSSASRTSPLLGLKVFILALISVLFLDGDMNYAQWLAVLMSVAAAAVLNWSGGSMPWQCIVWILSACVGYSLSDINIKILIGHFAYLGLFHGSTLCVCFSYFLCGLISLAALFFLPRLTRQMWIHAIPYSIAWFAGMLFLFSCFGSIGVVFGNIVQSSRGLISILLGTVVAAAGFEHIEEKVQLSVLARRISAAILMIGAIALFYLKS
ncbi:MAG: EamA family transporter [Candidatus Omnitrophota bacterium]|jgi:drug/metabolite transporter (DMT)-like permease|nr:MAG: EamA family transporter [Candidatus Omnitrophota bacterium]